MKGEGFVNLKSLLKGSMSDKDVALGIGLAADLSKPPQVREAAINRLLTGAQRQLQINAERMQQLRGGTYFKPGAQSGAAAAQAAPVSAPQLPALPSGFEIIK